MYCTNAIHFNPITDQESSRQASGISTPEDSKQFNRLYLAAAGGQGKHRKFIRDFYRELEAGTPVHRFTRSQGIDKKADPRTGGKGHQGNTRKPPVGFQEFNRLYLAAAGCQGHKENRPVKNTRNLIDFTAGFQDLTPDEFLPVTWGIVQ